MLSAHIRDNGVDPSYWEIVSTLKSLTVAAVPLLASGGVVAQTGTMMGGGNSDLGWMRGYGGGVWMPALLVVIVVALLALIIRRKDK